MTNALDANSFGGFSLGAMQLALPMSALREVVPFTGLMPLPCAARCVIGGIDLRGVVIPVLDLGILLGKAALPATYPCVIIVVQDGRLLGLLADEVTGIFAIEPGGLHEVSLAKLEAAVFKGSVHRQDIQALVSVLSPEVLASLPEVPMVADPEPARQRLQNGFEEAVVHDPSLPMMLMRCGSVPLAIEAMVAHATVADPQVQPSALGRGHCRGVMAHAGLMIPAIDLQSLCGLGEIDPQDAQRAFIVSLPPGMVAFLVSEVVDVVRALRQDIIAVPAFALPHPALFAGALPSSALPAEVRQRTGHKANQYLLVDAQALRGNSEVMALAQANTQAGVAMVHGMPTGTSVPGLVSGQAQAAMGRAMITYALSSEMATPLAQIKEILAYSSDIAIFKTQGTLLGFMVHAERSIPVLCLSRLTGGLPLEMTATASVLVVESEDELIGFAVPHLRMIEPAEWEPELPDMMASGNGGVRQSRKLALVGVGVTERMLPVLDLMAMAVQFQRQEMTV